MANSNAPRGLVPVRHLTGGCIRVSEYSIANTYATAIYNGDPVEMTGTGRNIQLAAAANVDNIGVFAGIRYVDASGNQQFSNYKPASIASATDVVALVYDDPEIVFEVQCDSLAEADVGTQMDWNAGTGSTTTGNSGAYAQNSTKGTSGKSLRIQRLVPRVDNAYGDYAKAEVTFAEHALKTGAAGAGGV